MRNLSRLAIWLVALAALAAGTGCKSPESTAWHGYIHGWRSKLKGEAIVQTLTHPGDPTRKLYITRATLPAGEEGPVGIDDVGHEYPTGKVAYDRPYFGLLDENQKELVACEWEFAFPLKGTGVVIATLGHGNREGQLRPIEFIRWSPSPKKDQPAHLRSGEMFSSLGLMGSAQIIPFGLRLLGPAPTCDSLVALKSDRIMVFDGATGLATLDAQPAEFVSPSRSDIFSQWYDNPVSARYFQLGASLALFDGGTVVVLDAQFRVLARHAGAVPKCLHGGGEPRWFILKPTTADPTLSSVLQPDGTFGLPPGALGLLPLPFITKILEHTYEGPRHRYYREDRGWLVAREGPGGGRLWSLASPDLGTVTPPLYAEARYIDSDERARWVGYSGPKPQVLALRRVEDGQWVINDGTCIPSDPVSGPLETLLAAADAEVKRGNEEDAARAVKGQADVAKDRAERKQFHEGRYAAAMQAGDIDAAAHHALMLGSDEFWAFLHLPVAREQDFRQALRTYGMDTPERLPYVRARIKAYDDEREQAAARAAWDQAQSEKESLRLANMQQAARDRQGWADWSAKNAAAGAANARAVEDQAYRNAMESYKKGYTDTLPK